MLDSRELADKYSGRISTGELNQFLATEGHPSSRGRRPQPACRPRSTRPPPFAVATRASYARLCYWVENELRARYGMEGIPVAIDFRRRS